MSKLFLIPTTISNEPLSKVLPLYSLERIKHLTTFICENTKTARNHLKDVLHIAIQEAKFLEINKHKGFNTNEILRLIKPLQNGEDVGLITDAGCPGVADPGSEIILFCHQNKIEVVPLIGPSSILLALMASGLNGQHFKFVGYLSKNPEKRKKDIKNLEQESKKRQSSMIIMETPYRSQHLWKDLILHTKPETYITVAMDISTEKEYILTAKSRQWKEMKWPEFNKNQIIFLIQAS